MAVVLAQVSLPYVTNLPADVAVNALHWTTEGAPYDADFLAITSEIDNFFNLPIDAPGEPWDEFVIGDGLSSVIDHSENACSVTFYNVGSPPNPPLAQTNFTLSATPALDINMPNEIAICLSLLATPLLPVPIRRRRGRMYLGPLNTGVYGTDTIAGEPFPAIATTYRQALAAACERMATGPTTVQWVVYSRADDQAYDISSGFIDNEFDTQRRRQHKATLRTTWPV